MESQTLAVAVCQHCADDLANRKQHIFIRLTRAGKLACTHVAIAEERP